MKNPTCKWLRVNDMLQAAVYLENGEVLGTVNGCPGELYVGRVLTDSIAFISPDAAKRWVQEVIAMGVGGPYFTFGEKDTP
jgi:hypothetical protein